MPNSRELQLVSSRIHRGVQLEAITHVVQMIGGQLRLGCWRIAANEKAGIVRVWVPERQVAVHLVLYSSSGCGVYGLDSKMLSIYTLTLSPIFTLATDNGLLFASTILIINSFVKK